MCISVAMCTYNGERYIREQLDSINNQTVQPNEIVICDDGSTDDTISIIKEFQKTCLIKIKLQLKVGLREIK